MKRLDFSGVEGKERFEILYGGVTGTTRGFQAPSETRVIGKVLDKLESIAKPTETLGLGGKTIKSFALDETLSDLTIDLEDAEFGLMKECVEAVQWSAAGARKATTVVDWFLTAVEPVSDAAK